MMAQNDWRPTEECGLLPLLKCEVFTKKALPGQDAIDGLVVADLKWRTRHKETGR